MSKDNERGRDRHPPRFSRRDADLGGPDDRDRRQSEWEKRAHPGEAPLERSGEDLGFERPDWEDDEFARGDRRSSEDRRDADRTGNDFERF